MPGKVKVKIVAGRSLPVMDRSNDTTDAYVEVKLGQVTHKTDVCRKSLNPQWNSEWFRFEVDDLDLQDEPLQIRLMDHDTYSANDAIGKVYLDLNPLLFSTSKGKDNTGKMISGWIPVYDTMHGIRGEVNLIVKVELFSDLNKYRQSSCGVRFFFTQGVPEGYVAHTIQGFVEELVVNDDPEYQWIDKIRTPRASNEARQTLFSKLSGEVQRKVGLKALELGGNAVIGYKQCFDLEGESGIVVRGIGTAIFLTKIYDSQLSPTCGVFEVNSGLNRESEAHHPSRFRSVRKHMHYPRGGSPGRTPRLRRQYCRSSPLHSMSIPSASSSMNYDTGACAGWGNVQRTTHQSILRHQLHHVSDPDDEELFNSSPADYSSPAKKFQSVKANLPSGGGGCGSSSCNSRNNSISGGGGGPAAGSIQGGKIIGNSPLRLIRSRAGSGDSTSSPNKQEILTSRELGRRISTKSNKLKIHVPMMETLVQTDNDEDNFEDDNNKNLSIPSDPYPLSTTGTTMNIENPPSFPNSLTSTITPPPGSYPSHSSAFPINSTEFSISCRNNSTRYWAKSEGNNEDDENLIVVLGSAASAISADAAKLLTNINAKPATTNSRNVSDIKIEKSAQFTPGTQFFCNSNSSSSTNNIHTGQSGTGVGFLNSDNNNATFISSNTNNESGLDHHGLDSNTNTSTGAIISSGDNFCVFNPQSDHSDFVRLLGVVDLADPNVEIESQRSNSISLQASSNNSFSSSSFRGKNSCKVGSKKHTRGGGNSDDSDEDSTTNNGGSHPKKERFAILRRRRKKEKFSTNCLIKRASEMHVDKEPPPPFTGTERIKEEFAKLLKRMTSGDGQVKNGGRKVLKSEDGGSKSHNSPYREPGRFFFRNRRRTASGGRERPMSFRRLVRSTSESHSLKGGGGGQTSLESLPSLGSEPVFDLEDDDDDEDDLSDPNCSSLIEMPTYTRPSRSRRESENVSERGGLTFKDANVHLKIDGDGGTDSGDQEGDVASGGESHQLAAGSVDKAQLQKFIQDLGYDTSKPLKLYISSMDALLVHDPLEGSSGSGSAASGCGGGVASFSKNSAEFMNALPSRACVSGGSGVSGTDLVVNLDSDSDLENLMQLSRTSTGSSTDATRPSFLPFSTFHSNAYHNTQSETAGQEVGRLSALGTETSLSATNTDSSQSSSFYHRHNYEPCGQPQRRHHYHTSRALDIRRRGHIHQQGAKFSRSRRVESGTGTTTTDDDDWSGRPGGQGGGAVLSDDNFEGDFTQLHDFGIITGCRSPIPEELSETPTTISSSWINKCAISNANNPNINSSTSPPNPELLQQQQQQQHAQSSSLVNSIPVTQSQPPPLIPIVTSPAISVGKEKTQQQQQQQPLQHSVTFNGHHLPDGHGSSSATSNGKSHRTDERSDSSANRSDSGSPEKNTGPSAVPPTISTGSGIIPSMRNHSQQYTSSGGIPLNRRSSESDLSTPPKGTPSNFTAHNNNRNQFQRSGINVDHVEMLEFPFITISQFPPGFIFYLGGTVTARSVKLLERISNLDEPETRDAWWNEIRMEIRSHCRAFGCTVVLGYEEHTTMCDDVCILSASGTAAVVGSGNLSSLDGVNISTREMMKDRGGLLSARTDSFSNQHPNVRQSSIRMKKLQSANKRLIEYADEDVMVQGLKALPPLAKCRHDSDGNSDPNCSMLHIPHKGTPLPVSIRMTRCAYCRKGKVPDVLLSTIEIPPGVHISGRSCLIQAQVFRPKRDGKGEQCAKEVSDSVPFLEYELHRRLINKLKVKGLNAIFGLKVQICLGDKLMVGIATGTAVYLTGLPAPNVPIICAGNMKTDSQKVVQFQKVVQDAFDKNRELFGVKNIVIPTQAQGSSGSSDGEESDDDVQDELLHRNKDTFVLEVDDAEDIDIISMLIDSSPPVGFNLNNIETLIGFDDHRVMSQQMFCQVWRCRLPSLSLRQFTTYFDRLIRCVTFKLRRMQPLVLTKLAFRIDLPEPDEMQLSMIGMALGVDQPKTHPSEKESLQTTPKTLQLGKDEPEMIFPLEDENGLAESASTRNSKRSPGSTHNTQQSSNTTSNLSAAAVAVQQLLKSNSAGSSGGVGGGSGSGPAPPSVTVVNPAGGGGSGNNGNVSSSCISVVSSSSSTSTSNNGVGVGVVFGDGGNFGGNGLTGGTSQSQSNPPVQPPAASSLLLMTNSKSSSSASSAPAAVPNVASTSTTTNTTTAGGILGQTHSYSVRHPHSKSAKFMAQMLIGAHKPIPAPMSKMRYWVEITPLSYIHGARIEKYLGNLNFFFIRETTSIREVSGQQESGGLTGFVHNFITEVLAIVRAHVAALGGNAMVSYFMTECALLHNPHKNQGQCVVNVGGDAVFVVYPGGGNHPEEGIS